MSGRLLLNYMCDIYQLYMYRGENKLPLMIIMSACYADLDLYSSGSLKTTVYTITFSWLLAKSNFALTVHCCVFSKWAAHINRMGYNWPHCVWKSPLLAQKILRAAANNYLQLDINAGFRIRSFLKQYSFHVIKLLFSFK